MYAWGGSDPRGWRGKGSYDYGSARARYDKGAVDAGATGARTYTRNGTPNMKLVDARGKTISSNSENPVIVGIDVTGSMSEWPGEIFDRLPLLYQTLAKYKPDLELAFAAIGDATCDNYPLQVTNFAREIGDLEANLKALGAEGGGGGQLTESYELFGYFMLNHCQTPKAKSPFLLIYGDEAFYPQVDQRQVKHLIGDKMESPLESKVMWQGLLQKFNTFYLQKLYGAGERDHTDEIKGIWAEALTPQRIIELPFEVEMEGGKVMPGYQRAVDIGMGLIAKHWGEYRDFGKSLDARHDDPNVKASVHGSLRFVDANPVATSVTKKPTGSKVTKSLL